MDLKYRQESRSLHETERKKKKKPENAKSKKVLSADSSTDSNYLFVRIVRALIFSTFL